MSVFKKEWLVFKRSLPMWLVLSICSFLAAWIFWVLVDGYVQRQSGYSQMPNPPTVTEVVFAGYLKTLAILLLFIVPVLSGLSFVSEKTAGTLQLLLMNKKGEWHTILHKFLSLVSKSLLFLVVLVPALITLGMSTTMDYAVVSVGLLGLLLFVFWLNALGILFSLVCVNSVAAVLLTFIIFAGLWMIGDSGASSQEWGKNWLALLSPSYHFKLLTDGQLHLSTVWYFLTGTGFGLLLAKQHLHSYRERLQ